MIRRLAAAGYNQIADVFHAGIRALFPGRVL